MTQPLIAVPTALYAQRRAELARRIGSHGVAIIPTAPEQQRNRDADFMYRPDSYFYYLSGFTEPKAWLVITGDGRSTVYCQPKDLEREIWDGYRLGPDAAPAALGVEAALSSSELDAHMPALLDGRDAVWYPFATHPGLEARIDGWLGQLRARVRYGTLCPEQQLFAVRVALQALGDLLVKRIQLFVRRLVLLRRALIHRGLVGGVVTVRRVGDGGEQQRGQGQEEAWVHSDSRCDG